MAVQPAGPPGTFGSPWNEVGHAVSNTTTHARSFFIRALYRAMRPASPCGDSGIRDHLDVGEHAVMIARADRILAVALAIGEHDTGDVDGPPTVLLARRHVDVVDAAIDIERAQRSREPILARPGDAFRRTVAGSGLAVQPQPRVLEVRATTAERREPAQEPHLVGV